MVKPLASYYEEPYMINCLYGRRVNKFVATLAFGLMSVSSWADWAEVGASYQCSKNEFSLYASINSNGGSITAPEKMKSLKTGNNKLTCRIDRSTINAEVWLSGPGQNGECGSGGRIQIMKLQVAGQDVVAFGESMLLYCSSTPTIVSISITKHKNGLTAKTCKGTWDWGFDFEAVKCEERVMPRSLWH